jgi:hypothetical protein
MFLSRDAVVLLRRPRMVSGTLPQLSTSVRVGVRVNVTLGIPAGRAIYDLMDRRPAGPAGIEAFAWV